MNPRGLIGNNKSMIVMDLWKEFMEERVIEWHVPNRNFIPRAPRLT